MFFSNIIGQESIKNHLKNSVDTGRIPHAQLFVGNAGSGTLAMAIAYAKYLLCSGSENKEACAIKCSNLAHPDLHFSFPINNTEGVKTKNPTSDLFLEDWRNFLTKQPYGNLYNWLQCIGIENKQSAISKYESDAISKKLQLKSFEGGFKVMVIWMAEKMNTTSANKLLKLIEEPPDNTVLLLVTENEDQIIATIKSRCQAIYFNALTEKDITEALIQREQVAELMAKKIAYQSEGDYNRALQLLQEDSNELLFEKWFITWIRTAFQAKGNAAVIAELINWSEVIAKTGRETQKQFLAYCLQFFRQALLQNYKVETMVFLETSTANFDLKKFAPFVHSTNILSIEKELDTAIYHIERNGNAKIILLDLSIKLTRLLHIKEAAA